MCIIIDRSGQANFKTTPCLCCPILATKLGGLENTSPTEGLRAGIQCLFPNIPDERIFICALHARLRVTERLLRMVAEACHEEDTKRGVCLLLELCSCIYKLRFTFCLYCTVREGLHGEAHAGCAGHCWSA